MSISLVLGLVLGFTHVARADMTEEFFARQCERLLKGSSALDLEDGMPGFAAHLAQARSVSKKYWTDSNPHDSSSDKDVLPPEVMTALGIQVSEDAGVRHVSAGLMHSYGYLFSRVQTPFGLKSKRWLASRVDERLGLRAGTFSPFAAEGEFLANVTSAFFKLIGVKARVEGAAPVHPRTKRSGVVVEHVVWMTPEGREVRQTIRTHIVRLLPLDGAPASDAALLIYETIDESLPEESAHRLVTGFPIDARTASDLMRTGPSVDAEFHARYNLYVDPRWKVAEHRCDGFTADLD